MKSKLIEGDLVESIPFNLIWGAVKHLKKDEMFVLCILVILVIAFLIYFLPQCSYWWKELKSRWL